MLLSKVTERSTLWHTYTTKQPIKQTHVHTNVVHGVWNVENKEKEGNKQHTPHPLQKILIRVHLFSIQNENKNQHKVF